MVHIKPARSGPKPCSGIAGLCHVTEAYWHKVFNASVSLVEHKSLDISEIS